MRKFSYLDEMSGVSLSYMRIFSGIFLQCSRTIQPMV